MTEKLGSILRSIWFKIGLVIFYILSPKAFTHETLFLIKAREYNAEVRDVLYAQYMENGDVKACLLLDLKGRKENGKFPRYQVELPIAAVTRHDHPRVKEREGGLKDQGVDFRFGIDEDRMKKGCDATTKATEIYTGEPKRYGRPLYGGNNPSEYSEPGFKAELYIGDWASEIYYISNTPLRRVRHAAAGDHVEADAIEYDVGFIFPSHSTGMRWWYAALLPPAVIADAVLAPWEWWMLLHHQP